MRALASVQIRKGRLAADPIHGVTPIRPLRPLQSGSSTPP